MQAEGRREIAYPIVCVGQGKGIKLQIKGLSTQERVANGIALFNEHVPDWRERIDTNMLDVGDLLSCPVTQVIGGFTAGLKRLGLEMDRSGIYVDAYKYGFDVPVDSGDYGDEYEDLTNEWYFQLTGKVRS